MKITVDIPDYIIEKYLEKYLDKPKKDKSEFIALEIESLIKHSIRPNTFWCLLSDRVTKLIEKWHQCTSEDYETLLGKLVKKGIEQSLVDGSYPIPDDVQQNLSKRYLLSLVNPDNRNYSLDEFEMMVLAISLQTCKDQLKDYLDISATKLEAIKDNRNYRQKLASEFINLLD